jgi:membrane glycosyltransferase
MNRVKWIIVLVLMLLAAPISAEMFKYVDKNGNVLYTDDLSMIPEEQRPGIEVFESTMDQAFPTPEDKKTEQEQTATSATENAEEAAQRLAKQREVLAQEAKALQEEMDALRKEKEAFLSSRRFKSGPDSRVTRQFKELNRKIAASQQKLQDFNKRKAAHEAQMKALQAE